MNPVIGRTGACSRRLAATCIVVVFVLAGCGSDDSEGGDGGGNTSNPAGTQVAGTGSADEDTGDGEDPDDGTASSGQAAGPERDEMRDAIAAWYLAEDLADSPAEADCIADAMLDAASIDELAELGVTIDTIDELYYGPLRNDDEFLVSVAQCVG